jgi:hypothetical protein
MASFGFLPTDPMVDQPVVFTSTSTDSDGTITSLLWDFDDDGRFDDASGSSATRSFATSGSKMVGLKVVDDQGGSSVVFESVQVRARPSTSTPTPSPAASNPPSNSTKQGPKLLSPFPVVRIRGQLVSGGVRVQILSVRAESGALVTARCRGRGCPTRSVRARVRPHRRGLRLRALERRLRAGVVLEIRVTKPNRVGKFTRLVIRAGRPPARRDLCVGPVSSRPVPCRG